MSEPSKNFVAMRSILVIQTKSPLLGTNTDAELVWGRVFDFPMRPVAGIEKLTTSITADPTTITEDNCSLPWHETRIQWRHRIELTI